MAAQPESMEFATTENADTASNENANTTDDQTITIFHHRLNYTAKHPLQNTWTLWIDNPGKKANAQSWSQNLKEGVSVDAVEDFWSVYNNIAKVDRLYDNSNYHLFKKGIRPEWEDPANAKGGKFSIQFPRNKSADRINDYWLQTIMAMIGEQFNYEDQICGGVVSTRKSFFRIALWIKSSDNAEIIRIIGQQLKQFLDIPPNLKLEFTSHDGGAPGPGGKPNRIPL